MDLSKRTELTWLGETVEVVMTVSSGLACPVFLTGALARVLWLVFGFDIDTGRRTEDVDFAVQCTDWETFEALARALYDRGLQRVGDSQHKFLHNNGTEIDLIPFGGVEQPDRTLAWPPEGDRVMNLMGFAEVAAETTLMLLPGEVEVPVICQHALALLKLLAWEDRRVRAVHKDAADLFILGRTYLDTRVPPVPPEEEAEVLERCDFETELAGAHLLGTDMAALGSEELMSAVRQILERETNKGRPLSLDYAIFREMRLYEIDLAVHFLSALAAGYTAEGGG
jgi:predicted nucleotidyltransferase